MNQQLLATIGGLFFFCGLISCKGDDTTLQKTATPAAVNYGSLASNVADDNIVIGKKAIGLKGIVRVSNNTGKPRLAVVPFTAIGDLPADAANAGPKMADLLISNIRSDTYEIYERTRLDTVVKEQDFQNSDLAAHDSTAIRIGRLATVQFIVVGSIMRLGDGFELSARVVDCDNGQIAERGSVRLPSLNDTKTQLQDLAAQLKLAPNDAPLPNAPAQQIMNQVNHGFAVEFKVSPAKRLYKEGEEIVVEVTANRDCFITLISYDSQKKATYLLPNPFDSDPGKVAKGAIVSFPPIGAQFKYCIIPPHGVTTIKALATTRKLKFAGVQVALAKGTGDNTAEFASPPEGAKAIGVVDNPDTDEPSGVALPDILKPDEWATDEVTFGTTPGG